MAAAPGLKQLARPLGLSYAALRRYRLGNRTPSPDVLGRLAKELRRQSKRLERIASNLEAEVQKGGKNA